MNIVKLLWTNWALIPRSTKELFMLTVFAVMFAVVWRIAYGDVSRNETCSNDMQEICKQEPRKDRSLS